MFCFLTYIYCIVYIMHVYTLYYILYIILSVGCLLIGFCPVGPGTARTAMGHRRRRGAWGRPNRNGPPPPPWGLGPSAESPSKIMKL